MQRSVGSRFLNPFLYCDLVLFCLFDFRTSVAAGMPVQDTAERKEVLPEHAIRQFGTDRFVARCLREVAVSQSGNGIASVAVSGPAVLSLSISPVAPSAS